MIGGKDNLALNLETLLDFCNDICAGGNTHAQESTLQTPKDYLLDHEVKGKRLSEAAITFRTPVEASSCIRNYCVLRIITDPY